MTDTPPDAGDRATSPWVATAVRPDLGDTTFRAVTADVAVIGAGLVGLTTALLAARDGASVVVVEASRVGRGVTAQATVKATTAHGGHLEDVARHGADVVADYVELNRAGMTRLLDLDGELRADGTDAAFTAEPHLLYAEADGAGKLRHIADIARRAGMPVQEADTVPVPGDVSGYAFGESYAFHPGTYLAGLARLAVQSGVVLIEHSPVLGVDHGAPCTVRTSTGTVTADRVVVATHVPILDRGMHFARYQQNREYAVAGVLPEGADAGMTIRIGGAMRSTRTAELDGERLLVVVGEGHPTGHQKAGAQPHERLRAWGQEHFGIRTWRYHWSTQDVFPLDHLPWAGRLVPGQERLLMAGGFSAWGITNGAACAGVLADLLAGRDSRFASMLDPRRPGLSALPSLVKQNLGVARTFASGRLGRPPSGDVESVEPGEAAVLDVDGTRAAVHRDTEGTLHAVSATCTHLGCTVQWNKVADSWDCPCHGSRFAPDGAVLHGPAVQPLRQVGPASAGGKPGTRR